MKRGKQKRVHQPPLISIFTELVSLCRACSRCWSYSLSWAMSLCSRSKLCFQGELTAEKDKRNDYPCHSTWLEGRGRDLKHVRSWALVLKSWLSSKLRSRAQVRGLHLETDTPEGAAQMHDFNVPHLLGQHEERTNPEEAQLLTEGPRPEEEERVSTTRGPNIPPAPLESSCAGK